MATKNQKALNPEKIRSEFELFTNQPQLVYLDNASTTPKPKPVVKSLLHYYEHASANIHRGIYPLASAATVLYEQSRNKVAQFIHAKPHEIIFTSGATISLNIIARLLEPKVKSGDEIVLTILEHHSNLVPWQELAKRTKATLKYIPLNADNSLNYQAAQKIITKKTKIIAFTAISNVTGEQLDIKKITDLAKKHSAYTIIDATQAAIHGIINVTEWDCDFLTFSGHKMFGPTGIGILYGKEKILAELEPVIFGGEMIRKVEKNSSTWNDLPYKFEPGTPAIAEAIALREAIEFIQSINLVEAHNHLQKLLSYTRKELIKRNCTILSPTSSISIISFTHKNIHPHDIAEVIGKKGICIRAGHHCCMPLHTELKISASARISLSYYNTRGDIEKFLRAFDDAQNLLK